MDLDFKAVALSDEFLAQVDFSGECWIWTGSLNTDGYPSSIKGKVAHRLVLIATYGPEANSKHCCHNCDNRACVRPSHLYPGTPGDNVLDMIRRGRFRIGMRTGTSVSSEEEITQANTEWSRRTQLIRELTEGGMSIEDLMCLTRLKENTLRALTGQE